MKQEVCICGWKSKLYPDGTLFMGFGGQLSCPECTKTGRNWNIEVHGNVDVIDVPPFKGWKISHDHKTRFIHYYMNDKAICGSKAKAEEYLIREQYLDGFSKQFLQEMHKEFCPKCLAKLNL